MFRYQGSIFLEEVHLHAVYRPHPSSCRAWTNRQSSYRHIVCKKVGKPCTKKEKINEFGSNLIFISSISSILPCTTTFFFLYMHYSHVQPNSPSKPPCAVGIKSQHSSERRSSSVLVCVKCKELPRLTPNLRNLKQLLYPWPYCYSPRYLKSMRGNNKNRTIINIINCWSRLAINAMHYIH